MKNILDDFAQIAKLDKSNLRSSISELPLQIKQTLSELSKFKLDKKYKKIKNIIISGMGGSIIGGHIIKSVYKDKIKVPFELSNSYTLPGSVSKDSLVILFSYSGNTEEPIFSAQKAIERKAKIIGITTGGKLEKLCQKNNIPCLVFDPKHNHCGQPRMGLGYSVISQLGILSKCGVIKISKDEINSIVLYLENLNRKLKPEIVSKNNPAKKIALELHNKIIVIISSEFLNGNAHTFANQTNENAKNFSNYYVIPEINHHLMEGLAYPKDNTKMLKFLFLNSKLYHPRNQRRYKITQDVVEKNNIPFIEYIPSGKTKLEQSFEILILGSYVNFYLAMLNNLDPNLIPWVDYFKKELA